METPQCLGKVVNDQIKHKMWAIGGLLVPMACVHADVTERLLLPSKRATLLKFTLDFRRVSIFARPVSNHCADSAPANRRRYYQLKTNSSHNLSLVPRGQEGL